MVHLSALQEYLHFVMEFLINSRIIPISGWGTKGSIEFQANGVGGEDHGAKVWRERTVLGLVSDAASVPAVPSFKLLLAACEQRTQRFES